MTAEAIIALVAAALTGVGMTVAAMKWIVSVAGKVKDLEREDSSHARDIADNKHSLKNQTTRIDALEHARVNDIERIVKLETAVQSVDRSLERIERGQDRLKDELVDVFNSRMDQHAESIRELREVRPKS